MGSRKNPASSGGKVEASRELDSIVVTLPRGHYFMAYCCSSESQLLEDELDKLLCDSFDSFMESDVSEMLKDLFPAMKFRVTSTETWDPAGVITVEGVTQSGVRIDLGDVVICQARNDERYSLDFWHPEILREGLTSERLVSLIDETINDEGVAENNLRFARATVAERAGAA